VVQGGLISRPPLVIDNPRTLAESMVLARFFIPTPSLIFRTEWRKFLQFDPVLLRQEDWDLLISAVARGFKLINLDTSQVLEHGGVRSRLSTQRHIHSATRFLEKNPGYLSPEAIAWFEDLNIRNPPIGRPQYISMILLRLAHKQVS
jgi:hypothetical protein